MAEPGDRRTLILEAACRGIARQGYHELRVEDVAAEAGISTALVYYYFHTRAGLLQEALGFAEIRSGEHSLARVPPGITGAEKVEAALLNEIDDSGVVRENWIIWSEASAAAVFDEDLRETTKQWAIGWVEMVADLIREGQEDGSIPASVNPEDAGERLTAVIDSLGTKWMLGAMSEARTHELLREAVRLELGLSENAGSAPRRRAGDLGAVP